MPTCLTQLLCLDGEGRCNISLVVPPREKTCLRGFRQREIQTILLSYRDQLESLNFACSTFGYDTFQNAKNKGADQTARMRRLVCAFVVRKPPKTGFLATRPNYNVASRTQAGGCQLTHLNHQANTPISLKYLA